MKASAEGDYWAAAAAVSAAAAVDGDVGQHCRLR
jgi:hypothetical protein